jgi:hypothetical protein
MMQATSRNVMHLSNQQGALMLLRPKVTIALR